MEKEKEPLSLASHLNNIRPLAIAGRKKKVSEKSRSIIARKAGIASGKARRAAARKKLEDKHKIEGDVE